MSEDSYALLDAKLKRIHALNSISGLIGWDELVNLPEGSADQRQEQCATMAQVCHAASVDPEIDTLLSKLEAHASELDDSQKIVIKEARKSYDRSAKLPAEFVSRKARLDSESYHAWVDAKKNANFSSYAPFLQRQLEHSKEFAGYLGASDNPYDCFIDLHDPGMDTASISKLFDELKTGLAPIVSQIFDSKIQANTEIFKGFPIAEQSNFLKQITTALGFNYKRGRIDTSIHPFCGGNGADTRMTTRFDEDNPLDSLFSAIHETGHGMYEQGLPLDQLHNALGQAAGLGAHESQSRLWENQVCRSRAFWKCYEPELRKQFPKQLDGVSSDALYLAINSVSKNPIRVDSDEVTYNLHIVIRFEIEKRLFDGNLSIDELPETWNALYKELLNIDPKDDAQGVLQDVHWSDGSFGYFPSYCLGNMLAAQLWYAALEELPDLERNFEKGDFSHLLSWLREKVHLHGMRYDLKALALEATGQELSPQSLLRYLKERYLPLYS
ncbi:MAG: carboxypeptidase M32 [Opitutaceae bacterium]|nr:carboxypeptidase M32 [Opitutaceae bacterium]